MSKRYPKRIQPNSMERPMAALFLSETDDLRNQLLSSTQTIHQRYGYLLFENIGVIAQLGQPTDDPYKFLPPFETLILDARKVEEGSYTWELTYGDGGVRHIRQITIGPQIAEGVFYRLNSQGLLMNQYQMDQHNLLNNMAHLNSFVKSPDVMAAIDSKEQEHIRNKPYREIGFSALRPYVPPPPIPPEHVERVLAFWEEYRTVIAKIGLAEAYKYSTELNRKVAAPEVEEVLIKYGLRSPKREY